MRYFKHNVTGDIFAFDDGRNPPLPLAENLTEITSEEAENRNSEASHVPVSVTRLQARAALWQAGLLEAAELAVSESDKLTQIAWADAQEFRRDSPILQSIAQALGLTSDDLDALFVSASEIVA